MKKVLLALYVTLAFTTSISAQKSRKINIDMNKVEGTHDTFYKECVGAGRANEGLRADWQRQLKVVKDECDFKFVRFHGVFHDDMGVYTETRLGEPIYNWQYVDELYDYIIEIGMTPFVELSFLPRALATSKKTVFWWKGNVSKTKSQEKLDNLIKEFALHLTERYGEEEVKTWYFEVWNEPDHPSFFEGENSLEDYIKMYKGAYKAIKSVSEDYRVGGPSSSGRGWTQKFIEKSAEDNIPLDFISTHAYNVDGFLDEFGTRQLKMNKDPHVVINTITITDDVMKKNGFEDTELHITEWSSSYSPLDPVHDTYMNASYVLNSLKGVEGYTNSMSYWVFTDIFEETGIPTTPFHGGFGLINLQGIKKPTFFAYNYLNQLGDTELVNSDTKSWACKQDGNMQLLLWDFTYLDQKGLTNKVFFTKEHKSNPISKLKVNVSNLENGTYELVVYKTGYKHNDAFSAYYEMGLPSQITKDQESYLKSITVDEPITREIIKIENGTYKSSVTINENDIILLKLNRL